ncbi:beta-N-acetylhexosaminidase [Pelagibacterales bacterium SAG-MED31]|nr:beta-N-acetylhexosaminidase [Pelagibacterales bacterium SAG-MED31]
MEIHLIFTKNNKLKLFILNNQFQHRDFKICFSLVYSIQSIEGGAILKKIGRYYEIHSHKNEIIFSLQEPRIGTYNLSCGPEGLFILDMNDQQIECKINPLKFEYPISQKVYSNDYEIKFNPIIPLPRKLKLEKETIQIKNLDFKIPISENEFFENFNNILKTSNINFNSSKGHLIIFEKHNFQSETYKILIDKSSVTIHYSDYGGKFYAIITLIQLVNFYKTNLPLGYIQDSPVLNWRGMHLDCARQFYSIEEIKRLLDYMSYFKLNRFHWHLTDNEAWRIELNQYPNLTKVGAFRGYNEKIPPFYGTGYKKSGGYYTRSEVKDLINYAKRRNIEIMPEIDLPAHSWTLLQIMPELRDLTSNISAEDVGNYPDNTINPALDETNTFLKNILEELSEIFSFNTIHVGVDERPKESWEGSPKVIKYMKENNISSFDELQDDYMNKIISIIKNKQKLTAAWNEAALPPHNDIGSSGSAGKVDKSCIIFAWEHPQVGIMSAKNGFKTVLCPGQKTYFDMAHNNSTFERGICWASTIEVKEVFEWQPLKEYELKEIENVLGIQGQLWSETITDKDYFDEMINPRLAALAEIAWSSKAQRPWSEFRSSLIHNVDFLSKLGWKFHNF